jgi:hypothetical protein
MPHERGMTHAIKLSLCGAMAGMLALGCGWESLATVGSIEDDSPATGTGGHDDASAARDAAPDASSDASPDASLDAASEAPPPSGTVYWADWIKADLDSGTPAIVEGTMSPPSGTVRVSYVGEVTFAQTSSGTDYWIPPATYTSATVPDPPPGPGIIALVGGTQQVDTLTFSPPVTDLVFAVASLGNGYSGVTATYNFDAPFTILSSGPGYYGPGTLTESDAGALVGREGYGVVRFNGALSHIRWTVPTGEDPDAGNWGGFTIGIRSQP